jgi:hypothetical protein
VQLILVIPNPLRDLETSRDSDSGVLCSGVMNTINLATRPRNSVEHSVATTPPLVSGGVKPAKSHFLKPTSTLSSLANTSPSRSQDLHKLKPNIKAPNIPQEVTSKMSFWAKWKIPTHRRILLILLTPPSIAAALMIGYFEKNWHDIKKECEIVEGGLDERMTALEKRLEKKIHRKNEDGK